MSGDDRSGMARPIGGADTGALRRRGMAHLPADRFREGGARRMTLTENALAGDAPLPFRLAAIC